MSEYERCIKELELAGLFDKDSDYEGMIGEAVKELLQVFSKQGHSGFSAHTVVNIFHELINGKEILSPLTGNDDEWVDVSEPSGYYCLQNKRRSSVFKTETDCIDVNGGPIFKDRNGCTFTNKNSILHNITFPYIPPAKREVIEVDE